MAGLILDSDALVGLLNVHDVHHKSIIKRLFKSSESFSISVVTYSEVLVRSFEAGQQESAIEKLKKRVSRIIEVDESIACQAAQLRSQSKIKLPDALIGATAIEKELTLLTFDEKLAKRIPGSELLYS